MSVNYKGLYVDKLVEILGNDEAENNLLSYAKNNSFTTLSLYDIQKILHKDDITPDTTQSMADFIRKAKTTYGIQHVAGIAENADFFINIISNYNHVRNNADEKLDVYNVEFEFWNQTQIDDYYCDDYLKDCEFDCNPDGAYSFFKFQLLNIHELAQKDGCVCETYVGWPDAAQAKGMMPYINRVLIHAYVADPATAYDYTKERLHFYAQNGLVNIIIIFSSEPDFSGPWLNSHNEAEAFHTYLARYNADPQPWKKNITLLGYQWFDYSNMQQPEA